MSFTNSTLAYFETHKHSLTSEHSDAEALCVGAPDLWVTPGTLKKHGITAISAEEARALRKVTGRDAQRLSKKLMSQLFQSYGYRKYSELDISERADIICNLNEPVSSALHERFDLVWDNGTVEHIMNINQTLENLARMTKVGGKIVHSQGIGDQTNFGYWTISPNFYLDFYTANGFEVNVIELTDRRGNRVPYREVMSKGSFVGTLIPWRLLPSYYFRLARAEISTKLLRQFPRLNTLFGMPTRIAGQLGRRKLGLLGKPFLLMNPLIRLLFGRGADAGPDWGIFVVATRKERVAQFRYPIQNIYRSHAFKGLDAMAAKR